MRCVTDKWNLNDTQGNSIVVDIEALRSFKLDKLRDLLRANLKSTKGQFSAFASKEACIKAFCCETYNELCVVMTDEGFDPATAKRSLAPKAAPPVAVVDATGLDEKLLAQAIETLGVLNPAVAAEITKAVKMAKESSVAPVAEDDKVTYGPDTVTIGKKTWNCILDKKNTDDPCWKYVPALDSTFMFNGFRAVTSAGGSKITFKYDTVAELMIAGDRILIVGPPGTGKTKMPTQLCHHLAWPMLRFNGSRDATVQDLVGTWTAKNGETIFVHGVLPIAMTIGAVLLVDEVDHTPAEINSVLHSVMEPGGNLVITSNGGEVIKPHENFRMIFTANTSGYGDKNGIHGAAKAQDAAFMSRFDTVLNATWMPPAIERKILSSFVEPKKAELIVKFATICREAFDKVDLRYPITHRHTIAWAKKCQKLGDGAAAFALTILAKSPVCDRNAIAELAQRNIGDLKTLTGKE